MAGKRSKVNEFKPQAVSIEVLRELAKRYPSHSVDAALREVLGMPPKASTRVTALAQFAPMDESGV